jgi:hypothetical protein
MTHIPWAQITLLAARITSAGAYMHDPPALQLFTCMFTAGVAVGGGVIQCPPPSARAQRYNIRS